MIRVPALRISVRRSVVLLVLLPALLLPVACGGAQTAGPPAPPATALPIATPQPTPTAPPPTPEPPRASAAGASTTPGASYPTRLAAGEFLAGDAARDRIALPGTDERAAFEATLASMGADAPTAERMLLLNTTDPNNPNWTYLPGNNQRLYVAIVREGELEKIDPALHDWRAQNVPGVELVGWQEVVPPPGSDSVGLMANSTTTVIGAYQGNKLVYWLNTEKNDGRGDWQPIDNNMPEGAREYTYDNERNTWVVEANGLIYEYKNGDWVQPPTETPTSTPEPSPYGHIATAPNGAPLQEYLDTSGTSIKPATYLEDRAFELVPAGSVLPAHVYEPETGWRQVDPNKAIFNSEKEVTTSNWFELEGPKDTIYDFKMPIRITTNLPTLQSFEYNSSTKQYMMLYWLHMSHLAHTYQNRDSGKTVDFETFVHMVKNGDPNTQIYVYKYSLNPDGTRGNLRQQMIDPSKGLTIQLINDGVLEHSPLATVVNPNNAQAKNAFIFSATDAGQVVIAVNVPAELVDMNNREVREEILGDILLAYPFTAIKYIPLYATSFSMKNPDANTPHFTLSGKDVRHARDDIVKYFREQLGIDLAQEEQQDIIQIIFD